MISRKIANFAHDHRKCEFRQTIVEKKSKILANFCENKSREFQQMIAEKIANIANNIGKNREFRKTIAA